MRIFHLFGELISVRRERRKHKRLVRRALKQTRLLDERARETILQVREYSQLSVDRLFAVIEAVRYIHQNAIPGAIVECGVWRGGAIMAAALTLRQLSVSDRTFYLYDTFAGMPEPSDEDIYVTQQTHAREIYLRTRVSKDASDWNRAGLDDVKRNLAKTGYNPERFITVPGKVEDTIPSSVPDEVAILRLDTDFYSSTRHELVHLYPRLVSQGILMIDDYYSWAGSRQATDEYMTEQSISFLKVKVGNSVVAVKN